MADDIQEAAIDYQVGGYNAYAAALSPRLERRGRWPYNGRYMIKIAS